MKGILEEHRGPGGAGVTERAVSQPGARGPGVLLALKRFGHEFLLNSRGGPRDPVLGRTGSRESPWNERPGHCLRKAPTGGAPADTPECSTTYE